jgi:uncharacterized protein with von Willebrand factor type A (vWA) domain
MAGRYQRSSWRYSRFDGTQEPFSVDAEDVMAGLTDDLLYHGDLAAALRRLLQEGLDTRQGDHVEGMREMMERIRQRREELASQQNELAERVAEALEEVLSTERAELDRAAEQAGQSGDPQRGEQARRDAAEHHTELDLLPPSLTGKLQGLMNYSFSSEQAHQRFDELLDELRRELTQLQLDRAAGELASATPEEREHLRAGMDALNKMLEQRGAGEPIDPSFEQFMEQYGDLFPGNASSLDELLEQLARRMAAASAMIAGMTSEQRQQLAALTEQLMGDMDLAWQMDRLGANLRDLLPNIGWDESLGPPGQDPLSVLGSSDAVSELAELAELESLLRDATEPGALREVDLDRVNELLGPDAARSLEVLAELTRRLEEAGLVSRKGGRLVLTPSGLRRLGGNALEELFSKLRRDRFGNHALPTSGLGIDRDLETKPYEFGDPFRLELQQTLRNAISRTAAAHVGGSGRKGIDVPIQLEIDDFAIERTEHITNASTVLAIDLSLSMPMRDNFLAAKKVAIALQALIATRYPRDYLGLVGFSATAREIKPDELPEVSWDFAYGTNLQHALALSRKMLASKSGSKQVIVITDGEPTAHVLEDGQVFFNYPPVPETVEATLREVARCTRERIVINSFVLDHTGGLRSFVQKMTKLNKGRAFYTTPEQLGDYVLVDFVEHRGGEQRRRIRHAD